MTEGLCETSSAAKDMDLHEEHAHAVAIHVQELGSKTPEKTDCGNPCALNQRKTRLWYSR